MPTTTKTTFKTADLDTMAAVASEISELPVMINTNGVIEACFTAPEAPEAARRFRNNGPLQNFLASKKTIYRLFRSARDRG